MSGDRALEALARMARLLVGRCVLRAAAASGGRAQVEALKDEVLDGREHLQAYGFSSHPLPGARGVVASIGGARNNAVVIVLSDPRHRPDLAAGDAALHDHRQQIIRLTETGIEIETPFDVTVTAAQSVTVEAAESVEITAAGAVTVTAATDLTLAAAGRLRLQAQTVEIAAQQSMKLDAGGYGETWFPDGRATWTQGTSSKGQSAPQPPEHP